ncbi:hypothetical protein B0H14DRAFT_3141612 [Mycena olivaceomarginata]|nr:hypothetical protein B0H14DRAFT_3141612 [Mycena olivaceomarginata]
MLSIARIVAFTVTAVGLASAAPADEVVSGLTKRVVYSCSDSVQNAFAIASYSEAQTIAANAASYIATNGADSLFQTYFGNETLPTSTARTSRSIVRPPLNAGPTRSPIRVWHDTVFTTTHSDGTKTVTVGNYRATTYLCPIFYNRASLASLCTGASAGRADSLVHEMSHAFGHTKDYVYGCTNTRALAISNPAEAANNAENFGCFSIAAYKATQCP